MSATKEYFSQLFEEQHHDFVTDDTYQDFLRMQREHQIQTELSEVDEELSEQHEGAKLNQSADWRKQENIFFSKTPAINDLPF